jgi:PIN domain nuclease of toxin-antitoxin system
MICATARTRALTVVTRDEQILAYGAAGLVSVLVC